MALLLQYTLIYASVLMLVALGGCYSEHGGVINLGLEGTMVMGALGAGHSDAPCGCHRVCIVRYDLLASPCSCGD